jgi:hypothetical protein
MPTRRLLVLGVLGLSAVGGWVWTMFRAPARAQRVALVDEAALASGPLTERAGNDVTAPKTESPTTAKPNLPNARRVAKAARDRARADQLRTALGKFWQASAQPAGSNAAARAAAAATFHPHTVADWTQGDYVKSVLHDQYIPLAHECYDEYLKRAPKGAGKVVVNFSISGTAELGGVIENVTLGKESTVKDETFATCLAESMYALTLESPPEDSSGITRAAGISCCSSALTMSRHTWLSAEYRSQKAAVNPALK